MRTALPTFYLCGVRLAVAGRTELGDVERSARAGGRLGAVFLGRGALLPGEHRAEERQEEEGSHHSVVPGGHFSWWVLSHSCLGHCLPH
jgi:hypothetical protein